MDQFLAEHVMRTWQSRLKLDHWQILFEPDSLNRRKKEDWEDHAHAFVWRARDYYEAEMFLHPDWADKWTLHELNRRIVHELLHLVCREAEFILDQLDGLLHRDTDNLISSGHQHAVEGFVDFLAYRLVEIGGLVGEEGI